MKCIVCSNNQWRYLFPARDRMFGVPGKFVEYRCERCGLVRLDPKPKNLKKYYPPGRYYSYSSTTRRTFFGRLREFLVKHEFFFLVPAMPSQGKRGRILDIGCGSGQTLLQLASIGWDVYGMDIDASAIQIARQLGLKNVFVGSVSDMRKYQDNFFDAIRLYHVIEHLENPELCIQLAYKKLKPGGELIIGTPNAASLLAKVARMYWMNLDAPRHLFLFTPRTLDTMLRKNRFKKPTVSFYSVGGWIGSIQYVTEELLKRKVDLINQPVLVLLFLPFEWMLDRFGLGDIFVIRASK